MSIPLGLDHAHRSAREIPAESMAAKAYSTDGGPLRSCAVQRSGVSSHYWVMNRSVGCCAHTSMIGMSVPEDVIGVGVTLCATSAR